VGYAPDELRSYSLGRFAGKAAASVIIAVYLGIVDGGSGETGVERWVEGWLGVCGLVAAGDFVDAEEHVVERTLLLLTLSAGLLPSKQRR